MITQSELHKRLNYNIDTGIFTWKSENKRSKRIGKVAGYTRPDGYVFIRIDKLYRAHRLAWFYVNGYFPIDEIDHIDGNPNNNSIHNLRESNSSQNKCNTKIRKDNTSKVKGLHWYKAYSKWQVNICLNKKNKCLGYFDDFFEACCVIFSKRKIIHGDFANNGNLQSNNWR